MKKDVAEKGQKISLNFYTHASGKAILQISFFSICRTINSNKLIFAYLLIFVRRIISILLQSKQILLIFMKENLRFFQSTSMIDLRNCKYQGSVNSKNQWHGFGMVLDDDMTICGSEWHDDQLNGKTFILKMNGNLLFGDCKANHLHSINMFKNDSYTILSCFLEDKPKSQTAAFDKTMTNALIFDSQEITSKKAVDQPFYKSFISIKEIKKQKEIIQDIATSNEISINNSQIQFLQFLRGIYKKYDKTLALIKKDRSYCFGFKNGIGFQFSIQGSVHQRVQLLSIGVYRNLKSLQVGLKMHNLRCFEEGRFNCKETITYSNLLDRPPKCREIYQKSHKLSLNFINKYYYLKDNYLNIFQDFISKKLDKQFHLVVSLSHERKKTKTEDQGLLKTNLKDNQKKLITKNKGARDKSAGCSPKQASKKIQHDQSRQQNLQPEKLIKIHRKTGIMKNKSLIELKPRQIQQYINNYRQIHKIEQNKANNKKQASEQKNILKKEVPLSPQKRTTLQVEFKQNNCLNPQKNKGFQPQKHITRINEEKIRQQLYIKQLRLERSPIRAISSFANLHLLNLQQNILQPRQKHVTKFNEKPTVEFQQGYKNLQNLRMKLLNDFKYLNQSIQNKNQRDPSSRTFSKPDQINEIIEVQPPVLRRQNLSLGLHYYDRFKSSNDAVLEIKRKE